MGLEFGLAIATFIVAVIGAKWDKPPREAKTWLIVLAAVTTLGTIFKSFSDDADKKFAQRALESMLNPSNAAYKVLQADVANYFKPLEFDQWECFHGGAYMDCFLSSSLNPKAHRTLALNSDEIAAMYKNEFSKRSNKKLIEDACEKTYRPSDFDEEFKDKVGALATSVFWQTYGQWPRYDYDDTFGVKIGYVAHHEDNEIVFKPEELKPVLPGKSCDVFYRIEQIIRSKYRAEVRGQTDSAPKSER